MELRSASRLLLTQMEHKVKLMRKHGQLHNQDSICHLWDVSPRARSVKDQHYIRAKRAERARGRQRRRRGWGAGLRCKGLGRVPARWMVQEHGSHWLWQADRGWKVNSSTSKLKQEMFQCPQNRTGMYKWKIRKRTKQKSKTKANKINPNPQWICINQNK